MTHLSNAELIGIPFAYGGRGPDVFDCYGLVRYIVERDTGRTPPTLQSAEDPNVLHAMMTGQALFWKQLDGPRPGAVALIRIGRTVCHCAALISYTHLIHAWDRTGGVTIERLDQWKHRIVGFYEYV
jgi:cell wall-associated NlpC family hydrolase